MPTNPGTTNLEAWWALDETSGTRVDSHGSNDLTDNNTVGSAAAKQSNGADFERDNSEWLSVADNASLSFGDEALTVGVWVKLETKAATVGIAGKWGSSNVNNTDREYLLYYNTSSDRFEFVVENGTTTTTVVANNFGAVGTGTWYYVVAQHDPTANQTSVSVDNGTADTAAHTAGIEDGGMAFQLGCYFGGLTARTGYFDGVADEVAVYRKVLSSDEISWLYNSGSGRAYSELTAAAAAVPLPLLMSGNVAMRV